MASSVPFALTQFLDHILGDAANLTCSDHGLWLNPELCDAVLVDFLVIRGIRASLDWFLSKPDAMDSVRPFGVEPLPEYHPTTRGIETSPLG